MTAALFLILALSTLLLLWIVPHYWLRYRKQYTVFLACNVLAILLYSWYFLFSGLVVSGSSCLFSAGQSQWFTIHITHLVGAYATALLIRIFQFRSFQ